jgi:tryptophanyl-tRNA synthetase
VYGNVAMCERRALATFFWYDLAMETTRKQRFLTGIKPSGSALHLGNYFGALKPFLDSYEQYDSVLMLADYHALTTVRSAGELRANSYAVVKDYLAAGFDPSKALLFKQSDISEHTELAWIFECLVTVPFLSLSHAYKDAVANGKEATAGLFNYPMLMAADILLYSTDIVPVGEDQRQHVEYAREAAGKFNRAYGDTFIEPKEMIGKEVAIVPGTDGRKMSKSYGNTVPLFATKDEITKAVMSIVTDSGGDRPENVYAIHKLLKSEAELATLYEANKGKYKALKDALTEDIDTLVAPMREKRASITDEEVRRVLAAGAIKAKAIASKKMEDVRRNIGVTS